MSGNYIYYTSTQYLGKHGVTRSCMLAMEAILTSTFRPEKITAVIGSFDNSANELVLFLVWDWPYPGITIVADGFGTHGGEGGGGLSTVLGLIKFYEVPLFEAWIYDREAFHELAMGTLTEEMFEQVEEAREYDWSFYPVAKMRKIVKGKQQFLEVIRADGVPIHTIRLSN